MRNSSTDDEVPVAHGLFFFALSYLTACRGSDATAFRRALAWIGAIAILPTGLWLFVEHKRNEAGWEYQAAGWTLAIGLPLILALLLRRDGAIFNAAAIAWVMTLWKIDIEMLNYLRFALLTVGVIAWGVREKRIERINVGIAGFARWCLAFTSPT